MLLISAVGCSSCSSDKETRSKEPHPAAEKYLEDARTKLDANKYTEARALIELAEDEFEDDQRDDGARPEDKLTALLKAELERGVAKDARDSGELDRAYEHFKKAAEHEPIPETRFEDLMAAIEAGRAVGILPADLAPMASQAVELKTNSRPAQQAAAKLWDDAGQADRALPYYQWLYKVDPDDNAVAVRLGNIYLSEVQLSNARRIFEKLLADEPDHVIAALKLADIYARLDSHDKARDVYEELVEAHPKRAGVLMRYANYLDKRGEKSRAKELRQRARDARPSVKKREMRELR
ncbi:MAG: tetratricopeptide repeat protein [Persicimonas sp.]